MAARPKRRTLTLGLVALFALGAAPLASPGSDYVEAVLPRGELPEEQLLDVTIDVFSPSIDDHDREALLKKGFSFVEAVAPCSTLYARRNRLGSGYDLMKFYHDHSEIMHGADVGEVAIDYQQTIKVGKFIDRDRPTWLELSDRQHDARLGERYYRHAEGEAAQKAAEAATKKPEAAGQPKSGSKEGSHA